MDKTFNLDRYLIPFENFINKINFNNELEFWFIKNYNLSLLESRKKFFQEIIDSLTYKILYLEIVNVFDDDRTKPVQISFNKNEILELNKKEFIENMTDFFMSEWKGKHVIIEQICGSCFFFEENNESILITYRCYIEWII